MTSRPASLPPQEGNQLIALFNAGRHAELETKALALSRRYPDVPFVWNVLGVARLMLNRDAVSALARAAALSPANAEIHSNLGNALRAQGRLQEACDSHRQAVALRPQQASGHHNLGIALMELGRLDEAEASYRQALVCDPGFVPSMFNLGLTLKDQGRLDDAEATWRRVVMLVPEHVDAHLSLGVLLAERHRLSDAEISFRCALALSPDDPKACVNLSLVLRQIGRLSEAEALLRKVVGSHPHHADAWCNLGVVLKDLRRLNEAQTCLERALEVSEHKVFPEAVNNLGHLHEVQGRVQAAQDCFRQALAWQPDFIEARDNLLFNLNYQGTTPVDVMLDEARAYGDVVAARAKPFQQWLGAFEPERPLRVGLVSGDIRRHPVGHFAEGALVALASQAAGRNGLHVYATHGVRDDLTERVQRHCQSWTDATTLTDAELAARIHADGIDVLIDLSGHTAFNRLPVFAWRPAPVQVSWLGYFATTGVAAMDWFIGDPWTLPERLDAQFTERIWRLPETRLCFTPPDADVPVSPLPSAAGQPFTFGCFNNLTKMGEEVVALWARVLHAVPDSRLVLKASQFDEPSVCDDVRARFAAHGVVGDSLLLSGRSSREDYLRAYHQVDIGLDPFPFTGGTTTIESLWMGVPVLTLAGDRLLARQGVGMMANAGLPDWVVDSTDAYVERAAAFARDAGALAALRGRLREQVLASPLFDAPRFAAHLEQALRGMWQDRCARAAR